MGDPLGDTPRVSPVGSPRGIPLEDSQVPHPRFDSRKRPLPKQACLNCPGVPCGFPGGPLWFTQDVPPGVPGGVPLGSPGSPPWAARGYPGGLRGYLCSTSCELELQLTIFNPYATCTILQYGSIWHGFRASFLLNIHIQTGFSLSSAGAAVGRRWRPGRVPMGYPSWVSPGFQGIPLGDSPGDPLKGRLG